MPTKTALTTGEVAKYCGVNFRTVIRWVERGDLKGYELPGRGDKRIEVLDLIAFLRKHHMPIPEDFVSYAKQVLVVDDDPMVAKALQRVLRKSGFSVLTASNGFQAGTMSGTYFPVLMTLDLQMPGLNGYEVLKILRNTERLQATKVLVISGLDDDKLKEALAHGADDFLSKPFSNEQLLAKITQLLAVDLAAPLIEA